MYVLIQHSGSQMHTQWVSNMIHFIESEFGGTAEAVVGHGDDPNIYVFDENGDITATFDHQPTDYELRFNLMGDDD